jgi:hypothetical protein
VRADGTGGRLVIDNDLSDGGQRLLARLSADEPAENAALICADYPGTPPDQRRCRPPGRHDEQPVHSNSRRAADSREWSVAAARSVHALREVSSRMSISELRWTRTDARRSGEPALVSLRAAIALLESYEPFCAYTREAIARHDRDDAVSTSVIRTELGRVLRSPIVLNRGLREAVMARIRCEDTTMSEIAIRCGRLKCDARGNRSGETSWLARRIGLLPEGGQSAPTPWVHTDVLALIAREGLGIAPREVELG